MSESAIFALRATGWLAALALLGALAATPLGRLRKSAVRARRPLGIAAAIVAIGHASIALATYVGEGWAETIPTVSWLRSGALALALLVPLLLTSFPPLVRRLGVRLWKPLHRLAYVAGALVVHHLLLAPWAPRAWVLSLAIALLAAGIARLVSLARDRARAREPAVDDAS
ncbi:MAG: ferric reductase-like transmembrane domain-containing protein [Myxococcota bacterium]|nr:ferric reductase-like transmembrane domain-containing protein [Myxococcota bacterium]